MTALQSTPKFQAPERTTSISTDPVVPARMTEYINRQERSGATVVRIEQVRRILQGLEPTN